MLYETYNRLMSRRKQYRQETGVPTLGMNHRNPKADCPLCPVWGKKWKNDDPSTWGQQHVDAEKLWQARAHGGKQWALAVQAAALEIGVAATTKQIEEHYNSHGVEQPAMSAKMDSQGLLMQAELFTQRQRDILTTVFHQRLMTTAQIIEMFYGDRPNFNAASKAAKTELMELANHHFLYRYLPKIGFAERRGAPVRLARQAIWLIGKASVPFLEATTGQKIYREQFIQMNKEVFPNMIIHDLRAVQLVVALHQALREAGNVVDINQKSRVCNVGVRNWLGPKQLTIGFYDQISFETRETRPDGFFAIDMPRSGWSDEKQPPSTIAPCFLEYDRNTRPSDHVVEQLAAYHSLALSRQAMERFPDLNVEGYAIPIVMVFSERNRVDLIAKKLRKHFHQQGIYRGAPIYLAAEEDWLENPLQSDLLQDAWNEMQNVSLMQALHQTTLPLLAHRAVWANQPLALDLAAAKPVPSGTRSEESQEKARAALNEKRAQWAQQKEDEQRQQKLQEQVLTPQDADTQPSSSSTWQDDGWEDL